MSTFEINIPSMMRQARIAVSQGKYADAEKFYALVLQEPEMENSLDLKTRYAFCLEKTGGITQAVELYQDIVNSYETSGEIGAAKSLTLKIKILKKLDKEAVEDSIEVDQANQGLIIQDEQGETYNSMELFNLEEESLEPEGDSDITQEIEPLKQEKTEEAIEAAVDGCVELSLTPIDDEPRHSEQNDNVPLVNDIEQAEENLTSENTLEQGCAKVEAPLAEDDEDFLSLKNLIQKGIHQNITYKSDDDIHMTLTDIGGESPTLLVAEDVPNKEVEPSPLAAGTQKKAEELFGDLGKHMGHTSEPLQANKKGARKPKK